MMVNPMMRILLPILLLIFTSTVLSASPACPAYDRKAWKHWIDADRNSRDARDEVLIAELVNLSDAEPIPVRRQGLSFLSDPQIDHQY